MFISTRSTTTISLCNDDPVVVREASHVVEIVVDAARLIMIHDEGSKVQAIHFLRQCLHLPWTPDEIERPILLRDALHIVEDLRETDKRQNSYANTFPPIVDEDIEF